MNVNIALTQVRITPQHLERKAVIYIRQSSAKQVRENFDSQLNQRALTERAQALGWHRERIEVFDGDLGQSGAHIQGRDDFKALAAEVALGHVGIVFGWEVSRLARNNADWYQLLDLAALTGALIADVEGVYDPRLYNDRLLLGLKGTMSEAELHLLRQRLNAGRLSKVRRGEYVQHLPTGLVRLSDKRVVKDSDEQVQHVIALVFTQFEVLGSCHKVLRYFKQHEVLIPRRQTSGFHSGELLWKKPSSSAIYEIVSNPAYAGAFVYGRRPTDPRRQTPGRHATGVVRKPIAEWQCIIHNAYPAYISWSQYLSNQARMNDNARCHEERCYSARGAVREGAALLQGLATCGHCGHVMKVVYKSGVRYLCNGLTKEFGEPMCAHLDGASIETLVVQAFFEALQPAQLDALDELLAQRQRERHQLERYHQQQVQRAQFEATLMRRRYEQVDPGNRLVAGELERQWGQSLCALREAQEAAERFDQQPPEPALSPTLRSQLQNLSQHLPQLWQDEQLRPEQRKELLRSLIARVILQRTAPDRVQVKIVWVSGHFSEGEVIPPIHRQADNSQYEAMVQRIEQLWREGCTDEQIAQTLTDEGFHSARRQDVPAVTVLNIRNQHHWVSRYHQHRLAEKIDGLWTIHGLARKLGVKRDWFYHRIRSGFLREPDVIRKPPYGNYLIRDDARLIKRLRREAQRTRHPGAHSQT
jgi:DNA invertase Pin-like site-specific DNA recombinase